MKVTPIRTRRVEADSMDLTGFLAESLARVPEKSVVAITSKVVALCEGNVLDPLKADRDEVIKREAEYFLPKSGQHGLYLTIKGGLITPNAGVDESNADGCLVLWPKDPQASAERCWRFLQERFGLNEVGVIITDSTDTPLRWGVSGVCIAHCGFDAVNDMIGKEDLFGRPLRMTKTNVRDGLAAACVLCMGEADERTPLAIAEDLPFVVFRDRAPTERELGDLMISPEEDLFGPLLGAVKWRKRET